MSLITKVRSRYRYSAILLNQLVKADFKVRYQGSVLGYLWSLLRPLLLFLIMYVVFTVFLPLGKGVPHYAVYLLLGIVFWSFFNDLTNTGLKSIVDKGQLIRKINFPKYNIIVAAAFAALINLVFSMMVVGIFMVFDHVPLSWSVLLLLPLLAELFLVSLGCAFLLSALYVKFRDVSYIWEVLLQAGLYATPIIYPLTRIHSLHIQQLLLLNPMAQIIQDARYVLVTPSSVTLHIYGNYLIWSVPLVVACLIFVCGAWYFRSQSPRFAEDV
jgi:ABC-2 type transport system permease protein